MGRMSDTPEVKLLKNGPIQIKATVEVVDHDGTKIVPEKFPIYLCRCGQSAKKPFCDGAHNKAGFDGTCARQAAAE
jgi:CDGSH iron-sulfur domain-containing protein 3